MKILDGVSLYILQYTASSIDDFAFLRTDMNMEIKDG